MKSMFSKQTRKLKKIEIHILIIFNCHHDNVRKYFYCKVLKVAYNIHLTPFNQG